MSAIPQIPSHLTPDPDIRSISNGAPTVNRYATTSNFADGMNSRDSFHLATHPIENHRPLKVIVIGAGYSGIYLGIRIPERLRNVSLTIYEKNAGVGGTWWENRYAGCACDVPSHSYQFSFDPNPEWSSLYAPSWEIRAYLEKVAAKFGADRFIKLRHEVVSCKWDPSRNIWIVKVENLEAGQFIEDEADVVISARGLLNNISWPAIEGLKSFEGELMHSATWNRDYDFTNKRIGIIGSGSSAIQIIPKLQRLPSTRLSCFIRSKTWISPTFSDSLWDEMGIPKRADFSIPQDLRDRFRNDPEYWYKFRLSIEEDAGSVHGYTFKGHPVQKAGEEAFKEQMKAKLNGRNDIYEAILPSFAPGCRRLTPGPGFLEALTQPNVDFIKTPITSISKTGITLQDSSQIPLDVLVCATGFQVSAPPPFPVTGLHGTTLSQKWKTRPKTYLSVGVDGIPNFFLMLGPNSAIGSGSLTRMIESTGDYITRCVRKVQREDIASMMPKPSAVDTFTNYVDAYFAPTVFKDECRSWYRKGDFVTGLWPGSSLHCMEALRCPRWEDWEYEYRGGERGKGGWLGNGWSEKQDPVKQGGKHLGWFLYPEFVDKPAEGRPEAALEDGGKWSVRPFD